MEALATAAHTYTSTGNSPYTVTAAYSGDNDFTPSSDVTEQAVAQAPTSTTVLSSPEPSDADGPVSVTTRVIVAAGSATTSVTGLRAGSTHSITATYTGNADFTSSSGTDTHTVTT